VFVSLVLGILTISIFAGFSQYLNPQERTIKEPHPDDIRQAVRDFLENGNIRCSVNFPEAIMPRADAHRITVANANVPNMVGQVSTKLAEAGLNIEDLLNKSMGNVAYTVVDLSGPVSGDILDSLRAIEGVLKVRDLGKPSA
jgi:D-3-phosphoglycerate dehydrogenase